MAKTKKIIISLSISLLLLIVLNYFIISFTNSDYVEVQAFKESMFKGRQITEQDTTTIQIKAEEFSESLEFIDVEQIKGKVLAKDVSKGEFVTKDKFMNEEQFLKTNEEYSYISIPITDVSYATCNKVKYKDKVDIYYTAKNKDVSNAIKNKKRLYSNNVSGGLVTCLLFENVEIISVHDGTGKETKDAIITEILIRLEKEDAMLVANLKSQGTFDIVLN